MLPNRTMYPTNLLKSNWTAETIVQSTKTIQRVNAGGISTLPRRLSRTSIGIAHNPTAKALKPDMLISDVIMTDMNGIDAAIKIRGMLPSCKILLFSGQAATADLLDRARVQGHEFEILAKPVHPQDLLARLRS